MHIIEDMIDFLKSILRPLQFQPLLLSCICPKLVDLAPESLVNSNQGTSVLSYFAASQTHRGDYASFGSSCLFDDVFDLSECKNWVLLSGCGLVFET